jgi:hypothetical protein
LHKRIIALIFFFISTASMAQLRWTNVDDSLGLDHPGIHVFRSTDSLGGMHSIAYYVVADMRSSNLRVNTDTTLFRRNTPSAY